MKYYVVRRPFKQQGKHRSQKSTEVHHHIKNTKADGRSLFIGCFRYGS